MPGGSWFFMMFGRAEDPSRSACNIDHAATNIFLETEIERVQEGVTYLERWHICDVCSRRYLVDVVTA